MSTASFQCALIAMLSAAMPCGGQAQNASGVDVQLRIQETRQHYDVAGEDIEQLLGQLRVPGREAGDGPHANGLTTTELHMTSDNAHRVGECRLQRVVLDMGITITTPRWADGKPIPEALAVGWRGIRRLIEAHEESHRQNALDAAEWLQEQLRSLGGWQSCSDMSVKMSRLFSAAQVRRGLKDSLLDQRAAARSALVKPRKVKRFQRQRPDWMQ
ncbi:MAG: DUF922 domain-containing protein [Xanthomonadales bacterium]|nr:DUF922 domain-containing protein [Xanthomonadales bacterium]